MYYFPAEKLKKLGTEIYMNLGLSKEKALFVSETLIEANLTGHDSHGIRYFPRYAQRIKEGYIDVKAEPVIVKETNATALINGNWAIGQVTARKLTEHAIEKAKKNMIASVGAFNCNHIGRIGYYTKMAAEHNLIAIMFVNVGHPTVSTFNGMGQMFGTNPFSVSLPTGSDIPFLVDYATSVVAAGKLSVAISKKEKIPEHWARDKNGQKTDNPNILQNGGWLLPFGNYKGYGLQMTTELIGAVLTGSRTGPDEETEPPSSNGTLIITINPEAFVGLQQFQKNTTELLNRVKKSPAIKGERVLIPGEPEKESKIIRQEKGIPVPIETWKSIISLCDELEINIESIFCDPT
jgi:LDH2 family malate/lactate/ureidoglycolate dehydrogenase